MRKEVRTETRKENKKREATGSKRIEISFSDSESSSHMAKPVRPIESKAMPKKGETWRKKSDIPESSASASSACASKPADKPATEERVKQKVRAPTPKRETFQRAKDLLKDAEAARKVYSQFAHEFATIQWFRRSEGTLECRNVDKCGSTDAMYWCHPCGFAYCLNCRSEGEACDHHIVNYPSELREQVMPDSIGSRDSPFDIGELIDHVIGQAAYFGADGKEQTQHRRDAYMDIVEKLRRGTEVGNTHFQSFIQHGIEDFPFAEFIYEPADNRRVPTLEEHFLKAQDHTAPLPIWRPSIMLDCQRDDLTDEEYYIMDSSRSTDPAFWAKVSLGLA